MHKAIQRTGANTYMPRKRDLAFSAGEVTNVK